MTQTKDISSIVRATEILRCMSNGYGRISEVSRKLGLSKSGVHKILATLESTGFVVQDPSSRQYSLGPTLQELTSNLMVVHRSLVLCALSEMEYLRDTSGETVGLHIPNGFQRVMVEEVVSQHKIRFIAGKGLTAPIYTSSSGKILLSQFPEGELKSLLRNMKLVPVTPNTITDKAILIDAVKEAKRCGYATSVSENLTGGASIAVPVKNYHCPVALGIIGPEGRFGDSMLAFADELKGAAARISDNLEARTSKGRSKLIQISQTSSRSKREGES